jgi:asparagine synthase (glutamine-hydrolysing)
MLEHSSLQEEVDRPALLEYLTFQNFLTERTLFKSFNILPAGSWLKVDTLGGIKRQQYWDLDFAI